jgi:hypothetical protein
VSCKSILDSKKVTQGQRICGAPGDSALRVNALEVANQQQAEIDPWRQARPAHRLSIKAGALGFDEVIEAVL